MKTVARGTYAAAQRKRRRLIEAGVEPWRVSATANARLDELWPVQLQLVPDLPAPDPQYADGPDEAESTRYFLERIKQGPEAVIELRSVGLGGDQWGGFVA